MPLRRASGSSEGRTPPRILIVDHHDSYADNLLVSLLDAISGGDRGSQTALLMSRTLILPHTDPLWQDSKAASAHLLPHFDAVILSPGPGRPDVQKDFGASLAYLRGMDEQSDGAADVLPTLGICLGHQGIAAAGGGSLKRARYLRHGLTSSLLCESQPQPLRWPDILSGGAPTEKPSRMTTYNSLVVDEDTLPSDILVTAVANDGPIEGGPSKSTERVVMAIQHARLPQWGLQFHPESISSEGGQTIMRNFIDACYCYWHVQSHHSSAAAQRVEAWHQAASIPQWLRSRGGRLSASQPELPRTVSPLHQAPLKIYTTSLGTVDDADLPGVFRSLYGPDAVGSNSPVVWLDSARPGGTHSRYSFMAKPSWQIRYEFSSETVLVEVDGSSVVLPVNSTNGLLETNFGLLTPKPSRTSSPTLAAHNVSDAKTSFFDRFNSIQRSLQYHTDCGGSEETGTPFKAGFIGYFGYEMKAESLAASANLRSSSSSDFPSAWFGFCDQVLAFDHSTHDCLAVGLVSSDEMPTTWDDAELRSLDTAVTQLGSRIGMSMLSYKSWTASVQRQLTRLGSGIVPTSAPQPLPVLTPRDSPDEYKAKVQRARELIAEGESYELCLTTKFVGRLSQEQAKEHLSVYEGLRTRNPAPYAGFLRLSRSQSICCSSPEKFLGVDREHRVEMKPIKGTLARAGYAAGEQEMLGRMRSGEASARRWASEQDELRRTALQCDAKERAENLMIVDLIRRDLLGFCWPDTVLVPTLMGVESYQTVHQLVTTVQGRKRDCVGPIAALARCFPPGSMTGAPKVRSVELLQALEGDTGRRGVYSGTLGWVGLDGAANFNVVIRSVCLNGDEASVGAGGAITYHSTPEKEWQEVLDKVGAIASIGL